MCLIVIPKWRLIVVNVVFGFFSLIDSIHESQFSSGYRPTGDVVVNCPRTRFHDFSDFFSLETRRGTCSSRTTFFFHHDPDTRRILRPHHDEQRPHNIEHKNFLL